MNCWRWEENTQPQITFLHHSCCSPAFSRDHLEMWHQFGVIRKGQWKAKTFSGSHYNTSPRDPCQCCCISNAEHRFQRNGCMERRQWPLGVLWHRSRPLAGSLFCSLRFYNLVTPSLENITYVSVVSPLWNMFTLIYHCWESLENEFVCIWWLWFR